MDEEECKFILCVLQTQMGKTFTAINRILTEIEQDVELGRSIHMVFTMNTLLNNSQFAKRLEAVEDTYGKGSVCVFASNYTGKYTHAKTLNGLQGLCYIKTKCPRVVVMCSNTRRYEDGVEFLKIIDQNNHHLYRAFAYYDELHKYISENLRTQIEEIDHLDIVKGIIALTATPDNIFKDSGFWSKLRLIKLDDLKDSNYAGYKDMIFNCVDDFFMKPYVRPKRFDYDASDQQIIGFIRHVLDRYPEILQDGSRSFIPAHIRRSGHNIVRDLIFQQNKNSVVIVINGYEKTLQFKDGIGNIKTLLLDSKDEEVCEIIAKLVFKHGLESRPIVYTGHICVGMGQTLTHKSLGSFTSAIFGHMDLTNDELYQLFGRITGRIKDWDTYVQTQVYCPTTLMHRCHVMEECAINISREYNGDEITQEMYREPMHDMPGGEAAIENIRISKTRQPKKPKKPKLDILYRIYSNVSDLQKACDLFKYNYVPTNDNEKGLKETSLNKKKCVATLQKAIDKVPTAYGTHEGKTGYRVYYPCYEDITKKETLRFVFIIRPVTNPEDPEPNPHDVEALERKKQELQDKNQELQEKINQLDLMCPSLMFPSS